MMQWSNLTKCGFGFDFNIVSTPPTAAFNIRLPSVLQRLESRGNPDPRISLQLTMLPTDLTSSLVRYCFPAKCCFHAGEQKIIRWLPIQENVEDDRPAQSHSHAHQQLHLQTYVEEHCTSEIGLPSSVFQAVSKMSLNLLFQIESCITFQFI